MDSYIYKAALYCADCGEAIREQIRAKGRAPADPSNEPSYDSNDYPKGPFPNGGGEASRPHHCDNVGRCLNAIVLPSGRLIGAWLENPLTADGLRYIRDIIARGGELSVLCAELYALDLEESQ